MSAGDGGERSNGGGTQVVRCERGTWAATASIGVTPDRAIDGVPTTRWTTDIPREPGQWFQIDFGQPLPLRSLELHTESYPFDSPSLARIDLDGVPSSYTPATPQPGVFVLHLDGKLVQTAKIIASDYGIPVPEFNNQLAWWSIYEVEVMCDAAE
jgi:hypothetical protein